MESLFTTSRIRSIPLNVFVTSARMPVTPPEPVSPRMAPVRPTNAPRRLSAMFIKRKPARSGLLECLHHPFREVAILPRLLARRITESDGGSSPNHADATIGVEATPFCIGGTVAAESKFSGRCGKGAAAAARPRM
jgi:hypothetical protein